MFDYKITSASKAATVACDAMGDKYIISSIDSSLASQLTLVHSWDEWTTTKEATCTAEGSKTRTCSVCSAVEEQPLPALGHICEESKTTKESTCTEAGVKSGTCSRCGETEEQIIPALEHEWDDGKITKQPTCTAVGEKTFTCLRSGCGDTKTEKVEIAPNAHEWDEGTITKAPTCTEVGVKTYNCKHNVDHTKTEEIPALDHDLSDKVISEPTAEKLGEVHSMCSREGCGYDIFSRYTLGDGTSPTMYPDGTRISDASYTPTAGGPFNLNGQEIEIMLQDPLGALGSGVLGLTVRQTDLPATFDGDVPIEHQHSYDIIPTVNGLEKSGKLSNKVRLLYKIPQDWDRADFEVFLGSSWRG